MFNPRLLREIYDAPPSDKAKKNHKKKTNDDYKSGKKTTLEGYTEETPVAPVTAEMSEPRARATRQKGQLNFGPELKQMLHAYGDPLPHPDLPQEPLPETVRVLDDIVTDFVIDSCHSAAAVATHAGRQKVKADDFHFMLRGDPTKLGRVQELIRMEKELKEARKVFDQNDDRVGGLKETGKNVLEDGEEDAAADGKEGGKKGKGKKAKTVVSEATEGKKRKRKE
ncbi:Transcription initiation factor TFIID subunit 13 [Arachnomyces sp. PD_36]|nr:Transcription initiation factor TFIID subunit 13 [Arachnomyces sp. PD_36]